MHKARLVVVGTASCIFTAADVNEAAVFMKHNITPFLNQFHKSSSFLSILLICKGYEQSAMKQFQIC